MLTMGSVDTKWPPLIAKLFDYFKIFELDMDLFGFECAMKFDFPTKLRFYMLGPFVMLMGVVTVAVISASLRHFCKCCVAQAQQQVEIDRDESAVIESELQNNGEPTICESLCTLKKNFFK